MRLCWLTVTACPPSCSRTTARAVSGSNASTWGGGGDPQHHLETPPRFRTPPHRMFRGERMGFLGVGGEGFTLTFPQTPRWGPDWMRTSSPTLSPPPVDEWGSSRRPPPPEFGGPEEEGGGAGSAPSPKPRGRRRCSKGFTTLQTPPQLKIPHNSAKNPPKSPPKTPAGPPKLPSIPHPPPRTPQILTNTPRNPQTPHNSTKTHPGPPKSSITPPGPPKSPHNSTKTRPGPPSPTPHDPPNPH